MIFNYQKTLSKYLCMNLRYISVQQATKYDCNGDLMLYIMNLFTRFNIYDAILVFFQIVISKFLASLNRKTAVSYFATVSVQPAARN